jgi:hypothetical protein
MIDCIIECKYLHVFRIANRMGCCKFLVQTIIQMCYVCYVLQRAAA